MVGDEKDFFSDEDNAQAKLMADRARVAEYRAHPGFNQSTAVQLLSESPRHAWEYRNRKPGSDPDHSRDREIGTVTHAFLLGATSHIVEIDAEDYRSKMAQESRKSAELRGDTPILRADVARARRAADAVREQLSGFGIELNGESEVEAYWKEGNQECKTLIDHVCADGLTCLDIKTGADANPRKLVRRILDAMNHIQAAAVVRGWTAQDAGRRAGRVRFIDVFVETSGLCMVTPVEITGSLLELGEKQWIRACRTWQRCVASGEWPGYTGRVLCPEAPAYALSDEMAFDEAAE